MDGNRYRTLNDYVAKVIATQVGSKPKRIIKCPNCDANLTYENGLHCEYCGAWFEHPKGRTGDVVFDIAACTDASYKPNRKILEGICKRSAL